MSPARKGGCLGAAAILAISIAWALATNSREGECTGPLYGSSDGCQCDPFPGSMIGALGIFFGTPWAVLVGYRIGALAGRLERRRIAVLAAIAAGIALVLAAIAESQMRCSTDPSLGELFARAAAVCVTMALALERWTRPVAVLPSARETRSRAPRPTRR
jgi:hypothetical protein